MKEMAFSQVMYGLSALGLTAGCGFAAVVKIFVPMFRARGSRSVRTENNNEQGVNVSLDRCDKISSSIQLSISEERKDAKRSFERIHSRLDEIVKGQGELGAAIARLEGNKC